MAKRPEIVDDEHLSTVEWRVAARKGALTAMHPHEQQLESRKASVRAKVEHVFLIVKRDFGFTKTRYRGLAKNLHHLQVAMASASILMTARATVIEARLKKRNHGWVARRQPAQNPPEGPEQGQQGGNEKSRATVRHLPTVVQPHPNRGSADDQRFPNSRSTRTHRTEPNRDTRACRSPLESTSSARR
ncbi:MAG: hypothetical protein WCF12_16070 [Propionicimonas sp.]